MAAPKSKKPAAKKGNKGTNFEKAVEKFLTALLIELNMPKIEIRPQKSGTQNGFDLRVKCLDEYDQERNIFFECKFYETKLDWGEIATKIVQLEASNYDPDAFIALSPSMDISNIQDNVHEKLSQRFDYPIRLWTPQSNVKELFSLDDELYEMLYGCKPTNVDRASIVLKYKVLIKSMLQAKDFIKNSKVITIEENNATSIVESPNLKTNLDKKLNSIYEENDPIRLEYHQRRCDYKIYLEKLEGQNNPLRLKILKWEENLRLKADRLTKKFNIDDSYTPQTFFHDFFSAADDELTTFFRSNNYDGDKEKLLLGVVFELAAKCPLNWIKKDVSVYAN